jgi:ABC-2 type transport system permease protein
MTAVATQSWWMTQRKLAAFVRQPWFLLMTLIQPAIWLFLFSALFRTVVELPGLPHRPIWTTSCRAWW